MEIKHIMPAYTSAGRNDEVLNKISRLTILFSKIRKFPNRFRRTSEPNNDNVRGYSDYKEKRSDRRNRVLRSKISSKLPQIDKRSWLKWGSIAVISSAILVGGIRYVNSQEVGQNDAASQTQLKEAKASKELNREFAFPLRDSSGDQLSELKYVIERVELRDEILVQGQKATAIKGRTFLIVSLKLTNEYSQAIEIDTRDYLRLAVNGDQSEWLAPDIHNDPVEVQALSTKYTRVGFAINEGDGEFVLRVGEIQGDKELIEIDL